MGTTAQRPVFAKPEIYEAPEERDFAELLTRPVEQPSHWPVVWYKSFLCQAARVKVDDR